MYDNMAKTLMEYTKCCITPEDDGYMALWSAVIFDFTPAEAINLTEGLQKRK